jgi:predicted MFS family arabinose efflux permease
LITFIVIGLAEAVEWPAQQALFVEAGRRAGMGTVMALNQMGSSVGFLSGSLLGALVVSLFGLEAVFRFAGLMVGLGAVVFWWRMRLAKAELVEYVRIEPVAGVAGDK